MERIKLTSELIVRGWDDGKNNWGLVVRYNGNTYYLELYSASTEGPSMMEWEDELERVKKKLERFRNNEK